MGLFHWADLFTSRFCMQVSEAACFLYFILDFKFLFALNVLMSSLFLMLQIAASAFQYNNIYA